MRSVAGRAVVSGAAGASGAGASAIGFEGVGDGGVVGGGERKGLLGETPAGFAAQGALGAAYFLEERRIIGARG